MEKSNDSTNFNQLVNLNSFDIRLSSTEHKIPIVNGIPLHSIHNPLKEANELTSVHEQLLKNKKQILILGIGFGYHVHQICYALKKHHENYSVLVVDPLKEVVMECQKTGILSNLNVIVATERNPHALYKKDHVMEFLKSRPGVIAHPESFRIFKEWYKSFLTFQASNLISDIAKQVSDESLFNYLSEVDSEQSLNDAIEQIKTKEALSQHDYLLLAFQEKFLNSSTQP